jgi:ribose/xylose/arabinose/galactoside ABC-type transport system permease subunit
VKKLWASPHLPLVITLLMLVALFSTASIMYEGFFSGRVVANLIGDNASLGIAAIGMTLVILSGGIDLSVGAVLGFTTIFVAVMIQQHHMPPLLAIALSLGIGTFLGLSMGFLIDRFDLPPFLVTLGGMFFARGLGFMVSQESVGIDHPFYTRLSEFAIPLGGKAALSATAIAYIVVFAVGIFVTHQSAFGRNVYALGGNEPSARLMGVAVGRTKLAVYAISGFCAALAGVVSTVYTGSGNPTLGVGFELDVIAAVVVGGTLLSGGVGSQIGTLAGVLIFGTIQTALVFDGRLNSWWLRIAIGGLLLVFILLQRLLSKLNKAH